MTSIDERIARLEQELERVKAANSPSFHEGIPGVRLASGAKVHPTCVMIASDGRDISIGAGTTVLRHGEWVGPITIGKKSYVNRSSYIRANVTIGDNVNIGPFVKLITDGHELGPESRRAGKNSWLPISVGSGTWIGAAAIIMGGVSVGKSCVIAAGAVVTKDVPSNTMVGGVPAKVIKHLDGHPNFRAL